MFTCNCLSIFRRLGLGLCLSGLLLTVSSSCARKSYSSFALRQGYLITLPEHASKANKFWTDYLYKHLQKRAASPDLVALGTTEGDFYKLQVEIDESIDDDFQIHREDDGITLKAKDERTLLWLIYQCMQTIGTEDARISSSDLPPHIISLTDTAGVLPFEYREAYMPANIDPDFSSLLGANNVNEDWGIWGHHLNKAIPSNAPAEVYATVDGVKYEDQYCFSAEATYKSIEAYILNNFGDGKQKSVRFCIFPNDDDCACTCSACKAAGNTASNASPAVSRLIARLAKRFPNHQFFTSAYLSTETPPTEALPANAGVIISAMKWPLKGGSAFDEAKITEMVEAWQKVTQRIYVWDYVSNFDDYFTPFPVLRVMQKRLQTYEKLGVKGVFLNGSGESYSTFADMQHYVLSALLMNPYLPVGSLVHQYLKQYYPSSVSTLEPAYMSFEDDVDSNHRTLNLYGGVSDGGGNYLQPESFYSFYSSASKCLEAAKNEERKALHQMVIALSMTRLEMARSLASGSNGCVQNNGSQMVLRPQIQPILSRLSESEAFPAMKNYRESGGLVSEYVSNWQQYISQPQPSNLLLRRPLRSLTPLDEDYPSLAVLTDGVHGLPVSYHCGWVISSLGKDWQISLPVVPGAHSFHISFLHNQRHKLSAPQKVELLADGKVIASYQPVVGNSESEGQLISVGGPIKIGSAQNLVVRMTRVAGKKNHIACDEIQLNP